jgi:hypothetical protein
MGVLRRTKFEADAERGARVAWIDYLAPAARIVWAAALATERRRQSRRTPKVLGGLVGRAATKPTLLRNEGWGTLRGDLCAWQEVEIEESSLAQDNN